MNLLETLHLSVRRQLMLVECGGERFLVGGGRERGDDCSAIRPGMA